MNKKMELLKNATEKFIDKTVTVAIKKYNIYKNVKYQFIRISNISFLYYVR